jgi:hypothetical protein
MDIELTKEEHNVIRSLKRLEKKWPKSLWIFADGNSLKIMKCGENGEHVICREGGMNPAYIVATININNDGGDW